MLSVRLGMPMLGISGYMGNYFKLASFEEVEKN
jgi:hypothetical protein